MSYCPVFQNDECTNCGRCGKRIVVTAKGPKVRKGARLVQVQEVEAPDGFIDDLIME